MIDLTQPQRDGSPNCCASGKQQSLKKGKSVKKKKKTLLLSFLTPLNNKHTLDRSRSLRQEVVLLIRLLPAGAARKQQHIMKVPCSSCNVFFFIVKIQNGCNLPRDRSHSSTAIYFHSCLFSESIYVEKKKILISNGFKALAPFRLFYLGCSYTINCRKRALSLRHLSTGCSSVRKTKCQR